jgi:hypothetical protein
VAHDDDKDEIKEGKCYMGDLGIDGRIIWKKFQRSRI